MVRTEHSIVSQVYAAKTDSEAADALIGQYIGFIRSETVKFTHAALGGRPRRRAEHCHAGLL